MTNDIWEITRVWPESFIMMYTTQCVIAKNFNRKFIRPIKTPCREDFLYSRSMHKSSKTWTYKSSYTCRWSRTRSRWERPMTPVTFCMGLVASLTRLAASLPSAAGLQWMALTMTVFQRTSLWLEIRLVRSCAARSSRTKTCRSCTIGSWGRPVPQAFRAVRQTSWKTPWCHRMNMHRRRLKVP